MDAPDLNLPELYFNRELSLLQFQFRVLSLASNEDVPLLERLRFMSITSSNLDEFFQVRVAGLKHRAALSVTGSAADGLTAYDCLKQISLTTHQLVDEQYRILNDVLIPELAKNKIHFLRRTHWNDTQAAWVKRYYNNEILPVLSPLGLDPAHPFPRVLNKSLNFIVSLEGKDAFGRESRIAIVQAPRTLPRLIRAPASVSKGDSFVFLSSIIHSHVGELFPGMNVTGCYQFRVTRDSELLVDEDEVDDLMHAIKGELSSHRLTDAVRLEVADNCTLAMAEFLTRKFKLETDDVYQVNGPVNLSRLVEIYNLVDRPDLKYPVFTPGTPKRLQNNSDIFEVIRHGDVLLYHPFQSFMPVINFVKQASIDPNVLAIKQTLYRSGANSQLVDALVEAAKLRKEVTVIVELRARFDEAENIVLASRLQEAGAHVVYGVVGYKTHAKMLLVVRREGRFIRRYVHLGTGNYHAGTARAYTDYGLLTHDKQIGEDVHRLFLQLTGLGKATKLKKLLQSPFTLHKSLLALINIEIENAVSGKPTSIIAKVNSLVEPEIIRALYKASQAGVKVDLIIRGICCLRPGVPGISDNITVRSIVGRFLEHTRIYYFNNNDNPLVYCASADWMDRNFFQREEACFPIEEAPLKEKVIKEGLMFYLSDNVNAWLLQQDGTYKKIKTPQHKAKNAQMDLLEKYAAEMG